MKSILLFATSLLLAIAVAKAAEPATLAYWRFEDPDNLGKDSGGNGHDLLVVQEVSASPTEGAAAAVFNPVPQTGEPNVGMVSIAYDDGALFLEDASAFGGSAFTVEALVRPGTAGRWGHIISRWGAEQQSWRLGFNTTDSTLNFSASMDGRNYTPFILSVPDTKPGDYLYVAATLEADESAGAKVTLRCKNLTRDSELITQAFTNDQLVALFESPAPLSIGGTGAGTGSNWRGRLDEVRFSNGVLPVEKLLITPKP
jgi:hypothetical protein